MAAAAAYGGAGAGEAVNVANSYRHQWLAAGGVAWRRWRRSWPRGGNANISCIANIYVNNINRSSHLQSC